MRVWDLETQHCMQIVSGHHSEIWSIDVDPDERYLVTGSADLELRFYNVKHDSLNAKCALVFLNEFELFQAFHYH